MDAAPPAGYELPEGVEADEDGIVPSSSLETTLGRVLFNETLPADYPFVEEVVDKKRLSAIVNDLAERYTKVQVAATLDALKDAGFYWATRSGVTVAISDVVTPPHKPGSSRATRARPPRSRASTSGPDHRRRASPGAHRDLEPGDQRGRQGDGGDLPEDQPDLHDGELRGAW